jgi:hypothetical protein
MDRTYIETDECIIQVNKYPKTTLLAITDDLEKVFVKNHRGSQRSGEKELLNTLDGSILTSFDFMYESLNRWNTYISPSGSFIALTRKDYLKILKGDKQLWFDTISVIKLKFSPDESKMLIITRDNTMLLINLEDKNVIKSIQMDNDDVIESFLFSPDSLNIFIDKRKRIEFADWVGESSFEMWDSNNLEKIYEKDVSELDEVQRILSSSSRRRELRLTCQTFSPDGTKIAFGTSLGIILLFNSTNGDFIHSFDDQHTGNLTDISISPDGKTVAGLSWEMTAGVWNIDGRAKYSFFIGDKYISKMNCFDNCIALLELVDPGGGQESFNIRKYYRRDDQEDIFRFQTTMNNHTKDPSETIFNRFLPIRNSFGSVVELVLKQEVDVAITLPDHKGYIIAKLNPAAAKQARKEMGLHKNYPLLFYKGKLVFKLEKNGYLVSASLRELIPSTTVQKLRDQIGLTPRPSSVSTQIMDSDDDDDASGPPQKSSGTTDSSTMDSDDDDDASEPQRKKPRTRELELLRLRF